MNLKFFNMTAFCQFPVALRYAMIDLYNSFADSFSTDLKADKEKKIAQVVNSWDF